MSFLSSVCLVVLTLARVHPLHAQPGQNGEYVAKIRLAEAYEQTHDIVNAVRLYDELYHTNPNDQTVFDGLTRDLIFLKRFDEAEKVVKARLEHDKAVETQLLYARIEAHMNKRDEALEAFHNAEEATHAKECMQLFPIVYAMMEVSYNQDVMELLERMRKLGGEDADLCSSQIASIYLRLGDFPKASEEFIALIRQNEGNVGMIEQRLAQYMTDSLSRTTVLRSLEGQILGSEATTGTLRLLAWLYGEQKDYAKALATIIKLDEMADPSKRSAQGAELLTFADRARNEGALEVAVTAYDEAIKRLKTSDNARQGYYISQAELGALKTRESFEVSRAHTTDDIAKLVTRYETFAESQQMNELTLDALLHAADLSFRELFDLQRAAKNYELALTRSHGMSDKARDAAFGLVDVAFASGNFQLAETRLVAIENILAKQRTTNEKEVRDHILYERALSDYFQGNFDSSKAKLDLVAEDASSDYSNDAIQLSSQIEENNNPSGLMALKIYSKASLAETSRKYEEARAAYQSIVESQSFAPLADDAAIRAAEMLVKLHKPQDAAQALEVMQEKMLNSPLLDVAAFRQAEIVEHDLHDHARAQKLYEEFLARYPNSSFASEARDRARRLRGDMF